MKIVFFIAFALFVYSANATRITVDYQSTNLYFDSLSGSFSGNDANNDGLLTFEELDDWSTVYADGAPFVALTDIGDFDYLNNIWTPNGLDWLETSADAFMTWEWNGSIYSASTSIYDWQFATVVRTSQVPEPFPLALLALSLLGIAFSRKMKAN